MAISNPNYDSSGRLLKKISSSNGVVISTSVNSPAASSGSSSSKQTPAQIVAQKAQERAGELKKYYAGFDQKLGGILPGGVSRVDAINTRIDNRAEIYDARLEAAAQQQMFQDQRDMLNKSFLEVIGLFRSPQEKIIQGAQYDNSYNLLAAQQIGALQNSVSQLAAAQAANPQGAAAFSNAAENANSSTNWGKIALIGGAVIAGLFLLTGKKR